ncbi:hypothetical protein CANINC_004089 [Pichia inconspicua]|uniref:DUF726 domain-containing protein n=1 Tax=Pichia inconspicua TaxID=52247 RepID=A0A4T0WXI5_9ASCO|nr:hypothetical protein CANINC_004089 [[Candida] inconspicua]
MIKTKDEELTNNSTVSLSVPPLLSSSKDTIAIEHMKAPITRLESLNRSQLFNELSKTNSDDEDLSDFQAENDFIEFQYNHKNSFEMIDHDLSHITDVHNEESTNINTHHLMRQKSPTAKIKPKELDINDDSDSDDEWKEINTQLNCGNIYNLKGEKVESFIHTEDELTKENSTVEEQNEKKKMNVSRLLGINKKKEQQAKLKEAYRRAHLLNADNTKQAYTRIDEEHQAKKYNEMNKKIDFLFQHDNSNLRKLHNSSSSTVNLASKSLDEFQDTNNFDSFFNNEGHDDNELNPSVQMMSTKSMLDDSQKIAYAALVKLIIVQMNTKLIYLRGSGTTKILKMLAKCQKSFTRWSMNVMEAIYDHLNVNKSEEIKMIETLSCHGIETSDLSKSFNKNITVTNNIETAVDNIKVIDIDKNETNIEVDIKWTLICDLFLILLESSVYDSRSRTLLLCFAESIGISNLEVFQFERRITDSLEIDEAFEIMNNTQTWDESEILKEHKKRQKNAKIVKIALATVAGGLVIGLSAGALAPVIGAGLAAGLTTVGITGTGGFLAGAGGTAIITTSGVMSGMRVGQNAMQHRVGSVKTFEFIPLHNNKRVNLIITVSGWMSGTLDDVRLPFSTVDQVMGDLYSLLWEPEMLTSMGQTINILANEILTQSIQQILGSTLLITLMAGLQLPMMLSKLGYLLDNPWNNSLDRAWKSGKVLADTLRRKKLGFRPITLVGFSLGARLIYSCLLDLAKTGDYGIVENVYIFGSPIVIQDDEVALVRSIVSGRFVNGYMKQDWILGYLFRATSGGLRTIAGLSPIDEETTNIENFDCSDFVKGHMQYREAMPKLLRKIGWEVLEDQFVEIEQPNPEEEERQRKLLSDFEKAQYSKKKKSWYNKFWGKRNKEWWEMYEEGEKEKRSKKLEEFEIKENIEKENDGEEHKNERDFDLSALKEEVSKIEEEAKKLGDKNKNSLTSSSFFKAKSKKNKDSNPEKTKTDNTSNRDLDANIVQVSPNVAKSAVNTHKFESKKLCKTPNILQPDEPREKEDGRCQDILSSQRNDLNFTPKSSCVDFHVLQDSSKVEKSTKQVEGDAQAVDYEDYDVNSVEHLQINYDDEIGALERKILRQQKENSGYGPVTGIDYGDEDEFPHDESKVQISFQ